MEIYPLLSVVHPLNNWVPAICYWANANKKSFCGGMEVREWDILL